jgi:hypothetical protein
MIETQRGVKKTGEKACTAPNFVMSERITAKAEQHQCIKIPWSEA